MSSPISYNLADFSHLNLFEKIFFYGIRKGFSLESLISGSVSFDQLYTNEPKIGVIDDGEYIRYYSDGRLKEKGSTIISICNQYDFEFASRYVDKKGIPINLPDKLDNTDIDKFFSQSNRSVNMAEGNNESFKEFRCLKSKLFTMMDFYNAHSYSDDQTKLHCEYIKKLEEYNQSQNKCELLNRNRSFKPLYYMPKNSSMNKGIIYWNLEKTDERNSIVVYKLKFHTTCSMSKVYETPLIFNNQMVADLFLKNFESDLYSLIAFWYKLLNIRVQLAGYASNYYSHFKR